MTSTTDRAPAALRHRLRPGVLAVLAVAALALGLVSAPPAEATNSCPTPIRAVLDSTPATFASTVALTFDDGPSPQWTPQVLDVLRARGVKATFFLLGSNVAAHPDIARRIVAEGHLIANHSYTHANFDQLSPAAQASEIDRTNQAIWNATGVHPCFFRGPGGSHHGASVKELAWARGMNIAGWTRDTLDWRTPLTLSPSFTDSIMLRATSPLAPHPTILMHDGSPGNYRQNTVNAVDRIITFYATRGYVFTDPAGRTIGSSAIQQRYDQLGGPSGFLGAPVTDELSTPDGGGAFTHYQRGSIYWSPATGAHSVIGAIHAAWSAAGWEQGPLGFPTTNELATPGGTGAFNHFQRGSIYWSPATGAHSVIGAIHAAWSAAGWEQGPLGFPTTDEHTVDGVQRSDFQHGFITWTPQAGAVVTVTG
jgi:peptidoglycan/xylan/chitin deacetylase (PgdA/CDA1 family)